MREESIEDGNLTLASQKKNLIASGNNFKILLYCPVNIVVSSLCIFIIPYQVHDFPFASFMHVISDLMLIFFSGFKPLRYSFSSAIFSTAFAKYARENAKAAENKP